MVVYAKLKHIRDKEFKRYWGEVNKYHQEVGYPFDWARQWEYPWVLKNTPFIRQSEVADVGGARCHFPCIVSRRVKRVTVIDKNNKSLVEPCGDYEIGFIKQRIDKLFKIKRQFDIVLCISVLEHIKHWEKAVENMIGLIKKGGTLVMTIDLFLDNRLSFRKKNIPLLLRVLSELDLGKIDLSEDNLYSKRKLQELECNMPHLYKTNYPDRTCLGIIAKKL